MITKHKYPTTSRAASALEAAANRTSPPVLSSLRSAVGFFGESNLMGGSALAVLSTALLIAAPAHGTPIAYEGFAYDAGNLAGNNGGTGDWGDPIGAWAGAGTVVSAADANAAWGGTDNSGGVHRASGLATRAISTTFVGSSSVPLYFSAEFQKNGPQGIAGTAGYAVFLALTNNDSTVNNSVTNTVRVGLNMPSSGAQAFNARIGTGTSGDQVNTQFGSYAHSTDGATTPSYVGSTVLLVGKIEFNVDGVNDRLTVWADPTGVETAAASVVVEGANIGWETPTFVKTQAFNLAPTTQGDGFIDNFRVGTIWADVVPPAEPFQLRIARSAAGPGACDFDWDSQGGKVYDLVSSTDLATPVPTWPVYDPDGPGGNAPYGGIPAVGTTTTLTDVPRDGARRFFAMVERDAPPLFLWDFEGDDNGGFTTTGMPNDWAWGAPNSNNDFGLVLTTGNGGSAKCWATNLGAGGTPPAGVIDPAANSILRSPNIDLTGITGARLGFAAAYDAKFGDQIEIVIRNAATDEAIGAPIIPINTTTWAVSGWTTLGPFDLSAADNTHVYLEFRYMGSDSTYIGLYIDDVVVTRN
jgi:hypothetical protein